MKIDQVEGHRFSTEATIARSHVTCGGVLLQFAPRDALVTPWMGALDGLLGTLVLLAGTHLQRARPITPLFYPIAEYCYRFHCPVEGNDVPQVR